MAKKIIYTEREDDVKRKYPEKRMSAMESEEDDADDSHDPYEQSNDIGAQGFRKIEFGPDDEVNYRIKNAYNPQARPTDSEDTEIHEKAIHMVQSQFYSGDRAVGMHHAKRAGAPIGDLEADESVQMPTSEGSRPKRHGGKKSKGQY